jgi:hypothetical protein
MEDVFLKHCKSNLPVALLPASKLGPEPHAFLLSDY